MPVASRMPEPGDVLLGRFRVESIIGQGGMGHVFRATILSNSGPVAIKVLSPEASTHPEAIPRFINEARATTQLKSPHVVKLFDAGTLDNGLPFIVMELLEGQDLAVVLEQKKSLPVKDAVDYVIQASDAIVEAHSRGIIHRDLKPSNLFLSGSARQIPIVKVLDFGMSKIIHPGGSPQNAALTAPNTLLGSPHYMSPEQLKSSKDVDARTDIWSLGVILYELIGGRLPFDAHSFGDLFLKVVKDAYEPLRVQKPQVPEGIDYVISRCLQKNRDERFATLGELVNAIAPFASPEGTARAQRMARAAGAALAGAGGAVGGFGGPGSGPHPLARTALVADRPSNMLQAMAMPGHATPGMQMSAPMPGQLPAPMPSPGMQAPMLAPMNTPFGAPGHQVPLARESSSGFAAPSSQPAIPIPNAAQQHTSAASNHELPRLPASSSAIPLYGQKQNNAPANQAPQAGSWNRGGPSDEERQRGASPIIVGVGIALVVFALVGVVLIVIALRARGHEQKFASTSSASAPSSAPSSSSAALLPTDTPVAATPILSAAPAAPVAEGPSESPPTTPPSTADTPTTTAPPTPPSRAATPPPPPHNGGSILNKRK